MSEEQKELWLPLVRFEENVPGYSISNLGNVLGPSGRILTKRTIFRRVGEGKEQRLVPVKDVTEINVPKKLFEHKGYQYSGRCEGRKIRITVPIHRLVMDAFKPIDEYPPIPKEDWDNTPESAKQFIRECVVIDHINDNPVDNRLENLRWTSSLQNSNHRKNQEKNRDIGNVKFQIKIPKIEIERFMV